MNEAFDVLIMGGGMVGSTIACGLAHSGLNIAVVDHSAPPAYIEDEPPHIRVSALSFASEQVLRNVGAWQYIEKKRLCPYRRLAVNETHAKTGIAAMLPDISNWARTEFSADDIGKSHLGSIVENDLVQLSLHEAMQTHDSISLFCPAKVDDIVLNGKLKQIHLSNGDVLTSKLIIGADGAQSQLRNAATIAQYKEQYEQQAFVCTVSYRGEQQDITWQSFTTHGPLAFLPLPDSDGKHYASLVWYDFPTQLERLLAQDNDTLLATLQTSYPADLPPLESVIAKAKFPLFKSHAKHYVMEGLALAGDAAHTINPLAGQGVNLGFMDAAVLIETIAQAVLNDEDFSSLAVLRRYEKKRRGENQSMMSLMDAFYYGFGSKHLPARVARNLGLGVAQRFGFAKNKVMQYAIGASGDLPRLAKPI